MNLSRTTRPACPFVAGQKIEDPRCFVGREYELDYLATRMSGVQPVSVNVVGELLLGKSSLLWHFTRMRPWEQQVVDPARFVVAYTCLLQATPQTEVEFYQALAAALRKLPAVEQITPLRSTLAHFSGGSREFGDVLDVLAGQGILPVFCVDEFEMLLKRREQFGENFYDRLRGFMNASQLMFVLSSRKTLKVCGEELQLKSAFFNMGQVCKLKDFSEAETEKLLLLPDPLMPALEPEERVLARKWGGRHPHRLQQAALCLFDARRYGKSHAWAKQQFAVQSSQVKPVSLWKRPLGLVLRSCRNLLDPLADDSEKCKKVLVNIVLPLAAIIGLPLLLVLWLTGWLSSDRLLELGKKLWSLL